MSLVGSVEDDGPLAADLGCGAEVERSWGVEAKGGVAVPWL